MTLFSWFIKPNSHSTYQQINKEEVIASPDTVKLINGLADEVDTFNNNTMWPIAKVRTTTIIIKKPQKKINYSQPVIKKLSTSLVTIPLS